MADTEVSFEGFKDTDEDESSGASAESSSDNESDESHGLFDTMAEEAEDDGRGDSEAESEAESDGSQPPWSFERFGQLPFELRRRIWELFCPEMRLLRPRVLSFRIDPMSAHFRPPSWNSRIRGWTVRDSPELEDMTLALRTVLSVHGESRKMALAVVPHTLLIDSPDVDIGHVRFNRDVDVIKLDGLSFVPPGDEFYLPGFSDEVKTVAFTGHDLQRNPVAISRFVQSLPNLLSVFFCDSSNKSSRKKLAWCTSKLVNQFRVMTSEKEYGYGEDTESLYCWPDLHSHKDFAKVHISHQSVANLPDSLEGTLKQRGIEAWPMVQFEFEKQLRRFESLHELDMEDDLDGSQDSDGSSPSVSSGPSDLGLDEYESEGIDDSEIVEASDEDDALSISSGPAGEAEARFSSPEAVTDSEHESRPVNRGRKRRVVTDSDDDSEVAQQAPAKRARTARNLPSESESEAESAEPTGKARSRQSRVVLSDSEEDQDDAGPASSSRDSEEGKGNESSENNDQEESDSQDEDEEGQQKLSLVERLRLHRQTYRVPSSEGSPGDGSGTDNSEEDDDDEADERRNGFILDTAEEDDEDEGDGGGDYYDDF